MLFFKYLLGSVSSYKSATRLVGENLSSFCVALFIARFITMSLRKITDDCKVTTNVSEMRRILGIKGITVYMAFIMTNTVANVKVTKKEARRFLDDYGETSDFKMYYYPDDGALYFA